jgi:hypothetical protein
LRWCPGSGRRTPERTCWQRCCGRSPASALPRRANLSRSPSGSRTSG